MTHHPKTGALFKDNLCLCRCLAHHLKSGNEANGEETPKALFARYQTSIGGGDGVNTLYV